MAKERAWRRCTECRREIRKSDRHVRVVDDLQQTYGLYCGMDCLRRWVIATTGPELEVPERGNGDTPSVVLGIKSAAPGEGSQ